MGGEDEYRCAGKDTRCVTDVIQGSPTENVTAVDIGKGVNCGGEVVSLRIPVWIQKVVIQSRMKLA